MLPLNKILNSLIPKILLSKHASISILEVHMVDNFLISIKKIENFTFEKICTREKSKNKLNKIR